MINIIGNKQNKRISCSLNKNINIWKINDSVRIWSYENIIFLIYITKNIDIVKWYCDNCDNIEKFYTLSKMLIMYYYGSFIVNSELQPTELKCDEDIYMSDNYFYSKNKNNNFWLNQIQKLMFNTNTNIEKKQKNIENNFIKNVENTNILDNYYFYPHLNFNNIKYIQVNNNSSLNDLNNNNMLMFNTNMYGSYYILPLTSLVYQYDTEYEGLFISKKFFERNKNTIPKIIHQIWIGKKQKPYFLMNKVETMNPHCQYMFWNEDKINNIFPNLLNNPLITKCPDVRGKVDVIRLYILLKYGGIYLDADIYPLKPIPDECFNHNLFVSFENEKLGTLIVNGIIGCHPNHKCLEHMIDYIQQYSDNIYKLDSCLFYYGRGFFTYFLNLFIHYEPFIYPSYYWFKYKRDYKYENELLCLQSITEHFGNEDIRMNIIYNNTLDFIEYLDWYIILNKFNNLTLIGDILHLIPMIFSKCEYIDDINIEMFTDKLEIDIQKLLIINNNNKIKWNFNLIKDFIQSCINDVTLISVSDEWNIHLNVESKYVFTNNKYIIKNLDKYRENEKIIKSLNSPLKYLMLIKQ